MEDRPGTRVRDRLFDAALQAGLSFVLGAVALAVIIAYVPDSVAQSWGIALLMPAVLLSAAIGLHAYWGRRQPQVIVTSGSAETRQSDPRQQTIADLIIDGREIRDHLAASELEERVDNETFTQWQGRVMGWVEKVERRLPDVAAERWGAFRRPIYPLHPRHAGAETLPEWAAAFVVELDERLERLESIRASA